MAIEVVNRQRLCAIDRRQIERVARATLEAIGRAPGSLTVAFVRDRAIRELNQTYRGKDRATDVLSFPTPGAPVDLITEETYLGDVVIATDTALAQADAARHSLAREVSELVIHGALHLCGYDHETDNGQMNRLELRLRRKLLDEC